MLHICGFLMVKRFLLLVYKKSSHNGFLFHVLQVHYSSTNSPGSTDSPTGSSKADPATPHTPNAPNIPHVHHYHHTPYTSHTMPDLLETPNVSMSAPRKPAIKRANLYAWVSLQKLSEVSWKIVINIYIIMLL